MIPLRLFDSVIAGVINEITCSLNPSNMRLEAPTIDWHFDEEAASTAVLQSTCNSRAVGHEELHLGYVFVGLFKMLCYVFLGIVIHADHLVPKVAPVVAGHYGRGIQDVSDSLPV